VSKRQNAFRYTPTHTRTADKKPAVNIVVIELAGGGEVTHHRQLRQVYLAASTWPECQSKQVANPLKSWIQLAAAVLAAHRHLLSFLTWAHCLHGQYNAKTGDARATHSEYCTEQRTWNCVILLNALSTVLTLQRILYRERTHTQHKQQALTSVNEPELGILHRAAHLELCRPN
jgi:hypothetical protein